MPALVTSYQEQALRTQFKKTFSVLSQATMQAELEGATCDGNPNVRHVDFWDELIKQLQITKTCDGTAFTDECPLDYNGVYPALYTGAGAGQYTAYFLKDGAILMPMSYRTNTNYYCGLAFDTNGLKGPNKLGWDLFSAYVRTNTSNPVRFCSGCSTTLEDGSVVPYFDYFSDFIGPTDPDSPFKRPSDLLAR